MIDWLTDTLRPRRQQAELPAELVAAIMSFGVMARASTVDENGTREIRPLSMSFLDARPIYMDDHDALSRRMRRVFPDLDDYQVQRALVMIGRRTREMSDDMEARSHLMASRQRSRRTSQWMRETDNLVRW